MQLVPIPHKLTHLSGHHGLSKPLFFDTCFEPSARFESALDTFSFLGAQSGTDRPHSLILKISEAPLQQEAYSLSIDTESITIDAHSESGLFRGLTTLDQIIKTHGESLPCLQIEDHPDLENRGYMLDISRCKVPKQEYLYTLVDNLTALKFNQLQLYTEHTFAYQEHSEVWKDASPLNADEIQALDAYCFSRYIELVPNQNSFGHMDRWLRHDTYKHLAECPDGYIHPILGKLSWGGTLKPNQASIDFVGRLYDELLPNFRSSQFNIGGDEPWELGQGWSHDAVKATGKHRVYLDHLLSIHQLVDSKKKTMQFWGDIILESPDLSTELPQNTVGIIWGYEAGHPFASQCATFESTGISYYVAPGTSVWNTIGGRYENAVANIKESTRQAIEHNANGMLLTDWGDFGPQR